MSEVIWTISDINAAVRSVVEQAIAPVWIQGEVGTLNIHRSGHVYLTLKDAKSQVKSVFFRGAAVAQSMNLRVGMQIEGYGRLTVYEVRGEYQFSLSQIRPVGIGNLQQRFEELKNRLNAEGLFDPARKKRLPLLPQRIGVVTSPGGAAIRDFLQIIERRFPHIHIKIYPVAVQGQGAEHQIARGVDFFNYCGSVDVVVVTRGGGSMEDLWAFNEEVLARSIAASQIPVISAVGHEIDFTISDFVADLRVPTPSAAAELVIGPQKELTDRIAHLHQRVTSVVNLTMERIKRRFDRAANSYSFREPARLINEKQQQVDELTRVMERLLEKQADAVAKRIDTAKHCMERALMHQADAVAKRIDTANHSMVKAVELDVEKTHGRLNVLSGRLDALNPLAVLNRGYAVLMDKENGKTVLDADLAAGIKLTGRVAGGSLDLVVE